MNCLVQTRLLHGVGAGGEKLPATRLSVNDYSFIGGLPIFDNLSFNFFFLLLSRLG